MIRIKKDITILFGWIFILLIFLKVTSSAEILFFTIALILLAFLNSKDNLFYLALIFIMLQEPLNIPFRKFSLVVAGAHVKFNYLFFIVSFIKFISLKMNGINFRFGNYFKNRELILLFFIFIITSIIQSQKYGMRPAALFLMLEAITSILFFISIPIFFNNRTDFIRFFLIISPIVIINFFGQVVVLFTKVEVFALYFGANLAYEDYRNMAIVRTVYSSFLALFIFMYGLYLLATKTIRNSNFKIYIITLIVLSFASIILSGTRSWSIAFIIIMVGWLLNNSLKRNFNILFVIVVFIVMIWFTPLSNQLNKAVERISTTIEVIYKLRTGKSTNESRIEKRWPRVIQGFKMSPIFGLGISNAGYKYSDGHVGIATNLSRLGLFGSGLLLFFWFKYLLMIYSFSKRRKELRVFFYGMIGIIFIHSTARIMFSVVDPSMNMLLPIFLIYSYKETHYGFDCRLDKLKIF